MQAHLRFVQVMTRIIYIASALVALAGCSQPPEPRSAIMPSTAGHALPVARASTTEDIGPEKIMRDIVGRVVRISEVTGTGPSNEWTFEADEFRQIEIVELQAAENETTIVIFMTTKNNPRPDEENVEVSGKLRLHYERKGEQWVLGAIENLTFRYSVLIST